MSRAHPQRDCQEIRFAQAYRLGEAAEVALEDYGREVTRAAAAEVIREQGAVVALHLCGLAALPAEAARADVEAFARDLSIRAAGEGGLGWS